MGSSSESRPTGKIPSNLGQSAERAEKTPVKHESRDRFSGAMEAFGRRNGSSAGLQQGDHSRNRSDDAPTPNDVKIDSERGQISRTGSSSKRVVVSSSRLSSFGEPSDNIHSRLGSSSGRMSITQRLQPGFESKSSSFTRGAVRGVRDETLRSFELLTIGSGKKK